MSDKYCPLCDNKLTKKTLPMREDGFIPSSYVCSSEVLDPYSYPRNGHEISHYVEGDYGMSILVEPYILQASNMYDKYFSLYVRNNDEEMCRIQIPAFKIPCEEKLIQKIKLLLVFS